jgi:hypothetical protein
MSFTDKYYVNRWYDGEFVLECACGGMVVDYLFEDEDINELPLNFGGYQGHVSGYNYAAHFYHFQQPPYCPKCGQNSMNWPGFSGMTDNASTISGALKLLLQNGQYLAACMLFSSSIEYQLNSLLYAALVDTGYSKEEAAGFANGNLHNNEIVRMLRLVLRENLDSFVLPYRNEIIHGKEFGNNSEYFKKKLIKMLQKVEKWKDTLKIPVNKINPSEKERWYLFMNHWVNWIKKNLDR